MAGQLPWLLAADRASPALPTHRRGIEVILDVVFNHTAEGNDQGPTLSFRCEAGVGEEAVERRPACVRCVPPRPMVEAHVAHVCAARSLRAPRLTWPVATHPSPAAAWTTECITCWRRAGSTTTTGRAQGRH